MFGQERRHNVPVPVPAGLVQRRDAIARLHVHVRTCSRASRCERSKQIRGQRSRGVSVSPLKWRRTFFHEVAQRSQTSPLSGHNERRDAVGVGRINRGAGSDQRLADVRVAPGHGLVQGGPTLAAALVDRGAVGQEETHHVGVLQLAGCETQSTGRLKLLGLNSLTLCGHLSPQDLPLYKGVSLFLLLMSGSAPASRRLWTHDMCSRDTERSRAVCSCKVRLSTEPG